MAIELLNELSPRSMPRRDQQRDSQARSLDIDELVSGRRDSRDNEAMKTTHQTQPTSNLSVVNTSEKSTGSNSIAQCSIKQSSSISPDVVDPKGVEFDRFLKEHIDMLGIGRDRAVTRATLMILYKAVLRHISTKQVPVVGENIYRQLTSTCEMEDWMVMGLCAEIATLRSAQFQFRRPKQVNPSSDLKPTPKIRASQVYPTPERDLAPTVAPTFDLPPSQPIVRLPLLSHTQATLQDYSWQPRVKRSASDVGDGKLKDGELIEDEAGSRKRKSSSQYSPSNKRQGLPDRALWPPRSYRYEQPDTYKRWSRDYRRS